LFDQSGQTLFVAFELADLVPLAFDLARDFLQDIAPGITAYTLKCVIRAKLSTRCHGSI
jgi:hypothetical protein